MEVMFCLLMRGALAAVISALVLAGLPTTSTLMFFFATLLIAFALGREDLGVLQQQILALHAGAAGLGADQDGEIRILEGYLGIVGGHDAGHGRKGAVVQLHDHAVEGAQGRGDFQQLQNHRLLRAEQVAGGDAEYKLVADLAGGTGDGDADGVSWSPCDLISVG